MGIALGYIVGGSVTAVASWRWAFVGEGLVRPGPGSQQLAAQRCSAAERIPKAACAV